MSFLYSRARTIPLSEEQTSGKKGRGEGRAKRETEKTPNPMWQTSGAGSRWISSEFTTRAPLKHGFSHAWFSPSCCSFLSRLFLFCLWDNSNSSLCCIFNPPDPQFQSPALPTPPRYPTPPQSTYTNLAPQPNAVKRAGTRRHSHTSRETSARDAANVFLLSLDKGLKTTVGLVLCEMRGTWKRKKGRKKGGRRNQVFK